jgi:hypothetical protein
LPTTAHFFQQHCRCCGLDCPHDGSTCQKPQRPISWRPTTLGGGLQSAFWQPFHKQPCFQHCARLFGAGSSIRGS